MNYYEILEIKRNSTLEEISNAYRRLSLKFHINNSSVQEKAVYTYNFHRIAEAFEVLSDPNKRGIYDIYGFEALRAGIVDNNGNLKGAYKYGGNAEEIFYKYFGTTNPFSVLKDPDRVDYEYGTMFSSAFSGLYSKEIEPQKNVEINLECTLEELFNGCVKKLSYSRRVLNSDGRTTQLKDEERDIEIFKGYNKSIVLTFPGYGNESPGQKNLSIKEKKHLKYKRVNEIDLIYTQKITLIQALNSEPVAFVTLDNRKLTIAMDEIISPQTIKLVKGEGMPVYNKQDQIQNLLYKERHGDLYIKFEIIFPKFIDPEKKEDISRLLEDCV